MKNIIFYYCFIGFIIIFSDNLNANVKRIDTITYPWIEGDFEIDEYYLSLLDLVLKNSIDKFGDYQLIKAKFPMLQSRAISEIKANRGLVDILWTKTSIQREQELTPIRYPLLRGLGAYRIFLIHKDTIHKFNNLQSKEALQKLIAGQGESWPDALILRDNNYSLFEIAGHESIFKMLTHKRFDYMPRALNEAWSEAELFPELVVDLNFALHYSAPYYFFVNSKNTHLINRLKYGFSVSEKNGTFKKLFYKNKSIQEALNRAQLSKRKIFELKNNYLSPETKEVIMQQKNLLNF